LSARAKTNLPWISVPSMSNAARFDDDDDIIERMC
jgi:hypothetical protein